MKPEEIVPFVRRICVAKCGREGEEISSVALLKIVRQMHRKELREVPENHVYTMTLNVIQSYWGGR